MTNREFDTFIIGLSIGALAFLWVGYRLRIRVERWQSRRLMKRSYDKARAADTVVSIRQDDSIGRGSPTYASKTVTAGASQDARVVLKNKKPRVIPLAKQDPDAERMTHTYFQRIPIFKPPTAPSDVPLVDRHWSHPDNPANVAAREIRRDAYAALVDSGFGRAAAVAALDACTPEERAGGLESWVAAALRRAASK